MASLKCFFKPTYSNVPIYFPIIFFKLIQVSFNLFVFHSYLDLYTLNFVLIKFLHINYYFYLVPINLSKILILTIFFKKIHLVQAFTAQLFNQYFSMIGITFDPSPIYFKIIS